VLVDAIVVAVVVLVVLFVVLVVVVGADGAASVAGAGADPPQPDSTVENATSAAPALRHINWSVAPRRRERQSRKST
jgi:hypothetical protein